MKAKFPGICGLCFCRFRKGDEIEKTPRQLVGPIGKPWSHKRCADYVNRVLKPEPTLEEGEQVAKESR